MIGVLFFRHGFEVVASQKRGFGMVVQNLHYKARPVGPQFVYKQLSSTREGDNVLFRNEAYYPLKLRSDSTKFRLLYTIANSPLNPSRFFTYFLG